MKILVTGAAGFIGFHLSKRLIDSGHVVVGIDNINDYYDPNLKFARLNQLGVRKEQSATWGEEILSDTGFVFIRCNLQDKTAIGKIFSNHRFDVVCNLAAQAGVRYSLENPQTYVDSNVSGFLTILEACRNSDTKKLVYASSSSVYGLNDSIPFSTADRVDNPISMYAVTKRTNELMTYTYSHLFGLDCTGLRFFTVYGPWGRPDMAMFLFTDAILQKLPIKVFGNGELFRDFTFIDDIIEGIVATIEEKCNPSTNRVFNIGCSSPVKLLDFIEEIEKKTGIEAFKTMMPIQPGDVERTWADVRDFQSQFGYTPKVNVKEGVNRYVDWHLSYYGDRPPYNKSATAS